MRRYDTIDLEKPGSGTWKHRETGTEEVILASTSRMALLREMHRDADEPEVGEALLARLVPVDIVFLERFRLTYYPKLELVQLDRDISASRWPPTELAPREGYFGQPAGAG